MAYDTIIGSGTNSAVLHFAPSARRFGSGELVLIDAGAEYRGYASDITRTYPVGGTLSAQQRELHSLVRAAELAAIERCTPGTEWREVHRTAALVIAEGLVAAGLLRGSADDLVASGATWLSQPQDRSSAPGGHGGHGRAGRLLRSGAPAGSRAASAPSRPGGLGPRRRPARLRGIRIEDNVLITADGPEVLTANVPVLPD